MINSEHLLNIKIAKVGIAVLGTVLNSTVILYILARKQYKKSYEFAYLNMAITDLLFALQSAVLVGPTYFRAQADSVLCRITPFLDNFLSYADLFCIIPLTVDRVTAVMFPTRYHQKAYHKFLCAVIAGCWLFPSLWILLFSLYLHLSREDHIIVAYDNATGSCSNAQCIPEHDTSCFVSFVVLDCASMILPLLFNVVSYAMIMRVLVKAGRSRSLNTRIIVLRAWLTCFCFTCSWMPFFVTFRIIRYGGANSLELYHALMMFSLINTVTDPCFYVIPNSFIIRLLREVRAVYPTMRSIGSTLSPEHSVVNSNKVVVSVRT